MSATDQLIVAVAALIVVISNLLPTVITVWTHAVQSDRIGQNTKLLGTINSNTNGANAAIIAELAAVKAELAAVRGQQKP